MSFFREKKLYCRNLYFSLKIAKSLQLCERRQIAKLHKYYLVCDYFSLVYIFLYFCISQVWQFRTYSHQARFFFFLETKEQVILKLDNQWKKIRDLRVEVSEYLQDYYQRYKECRFSWGSSPTVWTVMYLGQLIIIFKI